MNIRHDKSVLLFFKDSEHDSFFPNDRYIKRLIRPIYHKFKKGQKTNGFAVWCQLLVKALEQEGYTVHMNDYSLAFHNPHYPVGLVGYPHLLDGWSLPNPAILGPSLYNHPKEALTLMEDKRYKRYLTTCDWMYDVFSPVYGEKCGKWYAGMDTSQWADTRYDSKSTDVLIYDKIRWDRDHYEPALLQPVLDYLDKKGLSHKMVRYHHYDHPTYRALLSESRAMIFLCEHETQGMAYQEALASNVPVLAWDQGFWLDPNRPNFSETPIPASSVPYFSAECGEKFQSYENFETQFDLFWNRLDQYEPRQYVDQHLSFKGSAALYMQHYLSVAMEHQKTS